MESAIRVSIVVLVLLGFLLILNYIRTLQKKIYLETVHLASIRFEFVLKEVIEHTILLYGHCFTGEVANRQQFDYDLYTDIKRELMTGIDSVTWRTLEKATNIHEYIHYLTAKGLSEALFRIHDIDMSMSAGAHEHSNE